jgi:predicted  nucleic acid-binding Zn-ribbon protein
MAESRLNVLVGAKIQGLERGLKSAKRSLRKFERSTAQMGRSLTQGLTVPMMGFAAVSIRAFDQQAKAEASLLTALKGNKDAFQSLTEKAKEFQAVSLFGDETIIQQQSYLASLGMTEDQINEVIEASMDLASGTGQTLEFGVKNLAKTFAGLTGELGESIPALKELTTEQLKAGAAVDVVAEQFRGQAKAAAEAGAGAFTQLKNAMMDFAEEVGAALMPILEPLKEKLQQVTDSLSKMSTEQITAKLKTGLFIAAIGPVILVLSKIAAGFRTIIGLFPAFIGGLRALKVAISTHPLGALITGLSAAAGLFLTFGRNTKYAASELDDFNKSSLTAAERLSEINKEIEESGKSRIQLLIDEVSQLKKVAQANLDAAKSKLESGTDRFGMDMSMEDIGFLRSQIMNLESDISGYTSTLTELHIKQKEWNDSLDDSSNSTKELAENMALIPSFAQQWGVDFNDLGEKINVVSEITRQFVNAFSNGFVELFGKVEDLEGNIMTFGEKFKNFAKSLIGDLVKMIVKAAIFAAIMTAITGGSFTGVAAVGGTNFASIFASGLTGMATGGNVLSGQPYLVGEHGPELFVPSGSSGGRISSASQTAQMGIPDVRISGEDLIIVFDRARKHRNTLG